MSVNAEVIVGTDLEWALKRLKKIVISNGTMKEMKKRSYYEQPSKRKRRKQAEARKKLRKAQRIRNAREAEYADNKFQRRPGQYQGGALPGYREVGPARRAALADPATA